MPTFLSDYEGVNSSVNARSGRGEGEDHRVDRVLSFFSSRRNWDYTTPSPAGDRSPPLVGGGGYTHACGWGVTGWGGGVPIPRGPTLWYSRYICTLLGESIKTGGAEQTHNG